MAAKESRTTRDMVLSLYQTQEEVMKPFIESTEKNLKSIADKDYITKSELREILQSYMTIDQGKLPVLMAKFFVFVGGIAVTGLVGAFVAWVLKGGLS